MSENKKLPVLELKDVTKQIRNKVIVNHLNLSLQQGDIYGFLGPNGACIYRKLCCKNAYIAFFSTRISFLLLFSMNSCIKLCWSAKLNLIETSPFSCT